MLPVSAWPPGPPGAALSPFGRPRQISLDCHPHGYILPKGAWVVRTSSNSVIMRVWDEPPFNPPRTPGTGLLPGQPAPPPSPPAPPRRPAFIRYNDYVEAWRAWQRRVGRTDPPIRPLAGHRPPNWFGWIPRNVPCREILTLVRSNSAGTVLADGENVLIVGSGGATVIQAFSV